MSVFKPLYVFILSLCFLQGYTQGQTIESRSKAYYAEKIYLQLSNTSCITGEPLWFKAIVTQGFDNEPTTLSNVLHVELIDFDKRTVDKKKLKLNNGIASSVFRLPETYASGRYLIRAYTEWNNNFEQDFFFSQYIDIQRPEIVKEGNKPIHNVTFIETNKDSLLLTAQLQPNTIDPKFRGKLKVFVNVDGVLDSVTIRKTSGVYKLEWPVSKKNYVAKLKVALEGIKGRNNELKFVNSYNRSIVIDKHKLDLQFFPEGGRLVNGIKTKVAFKAIDYSGRGKQVSGYIVDEKDTIVTNFKSNSLGMGVVNLTGDIHKTLYGKIISDDKTIYKYPIQKALPSGYVLKVIQGRDLIKVDVQSKNQKDSLLYVVLENKGITHETLKLRRDNKSISNLTISTVNFPEGIFKLTLLNQDFNKVCERLFFNRKESGRIDLDVISDRQTYFQRDKIKLQVSSKTSNKDSLPLSTSILVLNKDLLKFENDKPHILSYFLLNSELKGTIENPNYYFDTNNLNRHKDLDFLMLTQGWRSYKYDTSKEMVSYKYLPEKELTISGNIGELFNKSLKKKHKEVNALLMTFGDPSSFFASDIDSTGMFKFALPDTYEENLEFVIQTKTKKGKKKDYTINIDKVKSPEVLLEKDDRFLTEDTLIKKQYVEKVIERKITEGELDAFGNVIQLDEVLLSGYVMTPKREEMMNLHGPPDVVIEDKELHSKIKKWSYGLYSVLLFNYPNDLSVRRVGSNGGFLYANVHGADFTFIIIDGIPVRIENYSLIESLPPEEIKSVEIIRSPKNRRKYVSEVFGTPLALQGPPPPIISFISIYTYSGKGLFGVRRTKGIYKGMIEGFSPEQEFYVPKYEDGDYSWDIPDFRSVVYWNPNITPNEEGEYIVDFYNGDDMGDMLVIVEAISKDGRIGYIESSYTVEKNLNN